MTQKVCISGAVQMQICTRPNHVNPSWQRVTVGTASNRHYEEDNIASLNLVQLNQFIFGLQLYHGMKLIHWIHVTHEVAVYQCKKQSVLLCVKITKVPAGTIPIEIRVLKSLSRAGNAFPKLINVYTSEGMFAIVTHWVPNDAMIFDNTTDSGTTILCSYFQQLLVALQDLHTIGYISRDVKPSNVLWNSGEQKLTLIDFDLATFSHKPHQCRVGTRGFMAPDVEARNPYGVYVDVYGAAVTMVCIICGISEKTMSTDTVHPVQALKTWFNLWKLSNSPCAKIPLLYNLLLRMLSCPPLSSSDCCTNILKDPLFCTRNQ